MTVIEIVEKYLEENGYDGLYLDLGGGEDDCGCILGDIAPCGEINEECVAAKNVGYRYGCKVSMMPARKKMKKCQLSVYEIIGSKFCTSSICAQKVCDCIITALENEQPVVLSFRNISMVSPPFLNIAIGQLYGIFGEDKIRSLLKVQDIDEEDLLKHCVDNAKRHFAGKKKKVMEVKDD